MSRRSSRTLNAPVYRPGATGHVESYFIKLNDPATSRALWLKFTVYAPAANVAAAVGEVWAVYFDPRRDRVVGAKAEFPIADCTLSDDPRVVMGGSELRHDGTRGALKAADGTAFTWDLRWDSADSEPLVPFPWNWMYTAGVPRSKTVTPHPDRRASGWFRAGDMDWAFRDLPGMQGHNWGREHAFRYAWMHCNAFDDAPHVVYEGFTARVKVGPWLTPALSGAFLWLPDGRRLRFDRGRALTSREVAIDHAAYRFALEQGGLRLEGKATARPEWMAGLHYRNPDGTVSFCLNSKTADLSLRLLDAGGQVLGVWQSTRAAALETLTRDRDHPVRMIL